VAQWRDEIQAFLQDSIDEIHQVVSSLEPFLSGTPVSSPSSGALAEEPNAATLPASTVPHACGDIDASRSRLENLKRQLAEKIRTHQTELVDEDAPTRSDNR
jgi:hypothetical protein